MTQKTGRFGASGREFCLYSLEKEDIEETLQLMDRCVGENLYQKEELEQAIGSSERAFLLLRTAEGELAGYIYYYLTNEKQIAEDTRLTEQKIQQVCQQDTLAPVGKIQSVGIKEAFRRQGLAEIQGYGSERYLFGCIVKVSLDSILRMILKKEKGAFKYEKLSCRINRRFW